ncbi:MAG: CHAT domain-containing protein, partial [Gemmatimonadetes bacterium]|nr:CHAT domain-containing protein [Gemmatimonadota bacterium]
YRRLATPGVGAAEALAAARTELRDLRDPDGSFPFRHPVYWAGFIVLGDPAALSAAVPR